MKANKNRGFNQQEYRYTTFYNDVGCRWSVLGWLMVLHICQEPILLIIRIFFSWLVPPVGLTRYSWQDIPMESQGVNIAKKNHWIWSWIQQHDHMTNRDATAYKLSGWLGEFEVLAHLIYNPMVWLGLVRMVPMVPMVLSHTHSWCSSSSAWMVAATQHGCFPFDTFAFGDWTHEFFGT